MENELFNDLKQSLNEAVEYSRGDLTKGRSDIITISDDEIEANQKFLIQYHKLSKKDKQKAMQYVNDLLQPCEYC